MLYYVNMRQLLWVLSAVLSTSVLSAALPTRHLQTCDPLCPSGGTIDAPDNELPFFPGGALNCSAVGDLLGGSDATTCAIVSTLSPYFNFASFCGCNTASPPDQPCDTCENGSMTDPTATFAVDFLQGVVFTCAQANAALPYLNDTDACSAMVALYDDTCCASAMSPASSANPAMPSMPVMPSMPAMASTNPAPAPPSPGGTTEPTVSGDETSPAPEPSAPTAGKTAEPSVANEPTAIPASGPAGPGGRPTKEPVPTNGGGGGSDKTPTRAPTKSGATMPTMQIIPSIGLVVAAFLLS